jgi:hypothetical protein
MLVKVTTLSECLAKGFTLNKQIETESQELADEYVWQARIELDVAKEKAKSPDILKMLNDPKTLARATALARKRAFEETAEKYRVKEVSLGVGGV